CVHGRERRICCLGSREGRDRALRSGPASILLVPLRTKRGVEIDGPWFIMNVTVRQNSIVVDTSKLSPDIHFWREARLQGSLLGSDPFVAALKEAGNLFTQADTRISAVGWTFRTRRRKIRSFSSTLTLRLLLRSLSPQSRATGTLGQ
ncbi:MAG: hypothetical protein RI946_1809, partial [Pseudomonadota bacterium]